MAQWSGASSSLPSLPKLPKQAPFRPHTGHSTGVCCPVMRRRAAQLHLEIAGVIMGHLLALYHCTGCGRERRPQRLRLPLGMPSSALRDARCPQLSLTLGNVSWQDASVQMRSECAQPHSTQSSCRLRLNFCGTSARGRGLPTPAGRKRGILRAEGANSKLAAGPEQRTPSSFTPADLVLDLLTAEATRPCKAYIFGLPSMPAEPVGTPPVIQYISTFQ